MIGSRRQQRNDLQQVARDVKDLSRQQNIEPRNPRPLFE
jgi:hypothetical protein